MFLSVGCLKYLPFLILANVFLTRKDKSADFVINKFYIILMDEQAESSIERIILKANKGKFV